MDAGNRKPENQPPPDPDQLAKLLELELMQKRTAWQQDRRRFNALRAVSFMFLFLVVLGALLAFWFFFSSGQMSELKTNRPAGEATTASPTASP